MKTIWHNPRCSKSRTALNLLKDTSVDVHVFHYLNEKWKLNNNIYLFQKLDKNSLEFSKVAFITFQLHLYK